jgi:hypothetical protein
MSFSKPYTVDYGPTGDNIKQGIEKLEGDIDDIYEKLNASVSGITVGQFFGLGCTWASTTSITMAAGKSRNSADDADLTLSSAMTKTTGAWVAGTGNGGLFSGTIAINTLYYRIIIKKDSDGSIDWGFSTSATATDIPVGYTAYAVNGFELTDGSGHFLEYNEITRGNTVTKWWKARLSVATGLAQTSYTIQALSGVIPAGLNDVEALFGGNATSTGCYVHLSSDGINAKTIFESNISDSAIGGLNELHGIASSSPVFIPIVSNQVYYKLNAGDLNLYLRSLRFGR